MRIREFRSQARIGSCSPASPRLREFSISPHPPICSSSCSRPECTDVRLFINVCLVWQMTTSLQTSSNTPVRLELMKVIQEIGNHPKGSVRDARGIERDRNRDSCHRQV